MLVKVIFSFGFVGEGGEKKINKQQVLFDDISVKINVF